MEEVTQNDWSLQELLLLNSLQPSKQGIGFLVHDSDPVTWIFWSFPSSLPTWGYLSFHKRFSFFLGLLSQHFCALKNLANCRDTLVNILKNILDCDDFHEDKTFDWIWRIQMILSNIDLVEHLWFVKL